ARWRLRNGQQRSAEVVDCQDGKLRVRGQSKLYMVRYRDGRGEMVEVATGCKDEVAARAVLTQLERRAELVRAGVMTPQESDAATYAGLPLSKHLDAYEKHLRAKGGNPRRIAMVRRRLERLARECRFTNLNKMSAGPVERWLVERAEAGMAAATRNAYRESLVCFGNWCRRTNRLTQNPFADLPRADQNVDRRHQRRALTEAELLRLLRVARLRPLAEYGRTITGKGSNTERPRRSRATWNREPLSFDELDAAAERAREALAENPALIAELQTTGHERALIYKMLALTGLRKGELASLTVGQIEFGGPVAYAFLAAADEKNRKGSSIPLRADLAAELLSWIRQRLDELQQKARKMGRPIPARLPPSTPLFTVPSGLARILDRDLAAAGIPKRDERNRVVDVHALRVTFGTHLCAAGVPLRTAQAAMRHSKPELTANVYTDPKLLDVAGAIAALPALVLGPDVVPSEGVLTPACRATGG
ncbi:MAG TPA: site-specific integrase, partial [Kiloniellales bacterium]|nr:site-specific integrase [Kiloniellales bacterium]